MGTSIQGVLLTTKFPGKATELLQYNHTINSAASSYVWENVYAYDKEFRQHVGRHPTCPWNIILQQAWTMLLKDRLKTKNSFFQKGGFAGNNGKQHKKGEPCRRYKKG